MTALKREFICSNMCNDGWLHGYDISIMLLCPNLNIMQHQKNLLYFKIARIIINDVTHNILVRFERERERKKKE